MRADFWCLWPRDILTICLDTMRCFVAVRSASSQTPAGVYDGPQIERSAKLWCSWRPGQDSPGKTQPRKLSIEPSTGRALRLFPVFDSSLHRDGSAQRIMSTIPSSLSQPASGAAASRSRKSRIANLASLPRLAFPRTRIGEGPERMSRKHNAEYRSADFSDTSLPQLAAPFGGFVRGICVQGTRLCEQCYPGRDHPIVYISSQASSRRGQ